MNHRTVDTGGAGRQRTAESACFLAYAVAISAVLAPSAVAAPEQDDPPTLERRVGAMGTSLVLEIWAADRPTALRSSEAMVAAVEDWEQTLSTWRPTSEVSRLNRSPLGRAVELSPEFGPLLEEAVRWCRLTDGAFDPFARPLVEEWGIESGGSRPGDLLEARLAVSGWTLDLPHRMTRHHARAGLDTGGFGKGVALDRALEAGTEAGAQRIRLNFGGQLALTPASSPWATSLAHPDRRETQVLDLVLPGGSLATSGNGERACTVDGERIGHLLDPRTGQPAPDFGSLTVWTSSALAADCLSTGLFVLGSDRALAWAREVEGVEVLVLDTQRDPLRVRATPGLVERVRLRPPWTWAEDVSIHPSIESHSD